MKELMEKIAELNTKATDNIPFSIPEKQFRVLAMEEEIDEYWCAKNKADELDALCDLLIFTLGTIERQGYSSVLDEALNRIMEKNLQKIRGSHSKRGDFAYDLIKPEGWTPPDLKDLVGE